MLKPLDFMIIGAQKSATTALHAYLTEHPRIAMPLAKEAPFFDRGDYGKAAWKAFSEEHFAICGDRLRGKASPQYMADPRVPGRIAALMPHTKLIAILRDPVDRAYSHYQMARRRETWKRPKSPVQRGALAKYRNEVSSASEGAVTIPPAWDED